MRQRPRSGDRTLVCFSSWMVVRPLRRVVETRTRTRRTMVMMTMTMTRMMAVKIKKMIKMKMKMHRTMERWGACLVQSVPDRQTQLPPVVRRAGLSMGVVLT